MRARRSSGEDAWLEPGAGAALIDPVVRDVEARSMTSPKSTPAPATADAALANNRRTVQAYEGYARRYAAAVSPEPSGIGAEGLQRLAAAIRDGGAASAPARGTPFGARVLEVGSGPGWDADALEALGVSVRRTDVTQAFREFQAERGRQIEALDLLTDNLGGPYDGVMALCVLLHVERELVEGILARVSGALRPGGSFLVSLRLGEGELWETGESGAYRVVLWDEAAFLRGLAAAGFEVVWQARALDGDGDWLTVLARR